MLWVRTDRMTWRCDDASEYLTIVVRPVKDEFEWKINRLDTAIESGKQNCALDAMNHAVAMLKTIQAKHSPAEQIQVN